MKPLQSVAMGFVFIALYARWHGYDLYADPVGWVLVLLGVRRLPAGTPYLTPIPFRGRPNASYLVPHTVRAMAEVRGDALETLCAAIDANTERAFGGAW